MFDGVSEHAINGGKYGDDFASACFSLGNGIAYSKFGHEISSSPTRCVRRQQHQPHEIRGQLQSFQSMVNILKDSLFFVLLNRGFTLVDKRELVLCNDRVSVFWSGVF